ncbi:ABC transporter ATP-binding protein [bacterium]|nr:ABC transporter ATP-binding protein [bacterium]
MLDHRGQRGSASPSFRGPGFRGGFRGPGFGPPGAHFVHGAVKPEDPRKTLKRFWEYLKPHRVKLLLIFSLVIVTSLLMLAGPYLIGKAIDNYIIPKDFRGLLRLVALMIILYVVNSLLIWLQGYISVRTVQRIVFQLRKDLFNKLQSLPLRFFDSTPHGDVMSRLTNDIDTINMSLGMGLTQIFSSIISIIGTIIIMLRMSPLLTLVSLIVVPLTLLVTTLVSSRTRESFLNNQTILGQLNSVAEENINGLKVVKIFAREKREIEKFESINEELRRVGIRAQIYAGVMGPLMNVVNNLSFAFIAGFGGWLSARDIVSVGTVASFIIYSRQFTRPINELANLFNMMQSAIAGAERVFKVMDEPPEPVDPPDAVELKDVKGEVEFRNVYFSYKEDVPVLKDINFHVKPGQTIALVGPTGAGKTTIVNLLTRFYDVNSGAILIDGIDIRKIKRSCLRSLLGIVLQDTYLFSESIKENIKYGRLDATDQEVIEAARLANAEHFILRLPKGYDTVLTDGGENLSQGQRQLLAIARAILADPAILILDEATSNVDTKTEKQIQSAMLKLMEGRTSFVIAHRLSTIRNADMILVINNGEIVERGTHEELLRKKGFYYNLYMSQFGIEEKVTEAV